GVGGGGSEQRCGRAAGEIGEPALVHRRQTVIGRRAAGAVGVAVSEQRLARGDRARAHHVPPDIEREHSRGAGVGGRERERGGGGDVGLGEEPCAPAGLIGAKYTKQLAAPAAQGAQELCVGRSLHQGRAVGGVRG